MEKILELLMSNPELIVSTVREYIEKYKPVVYSLAQEIVNIYKDYSNNTEYPQIVAKTKKNLYNAYIEVGFSEDQALALMINDNLQLMKNINSQKKSLAINNKSAKIH